MINQNKKIRCYVDKHFIIEISLLLPDKQKKIIISLFISDNIKVKELKEFISKDFDFPINTMRFFSPLQGTLEDSYEFQFEQDKKINLNLILIAPIESAHDLNPKNILKNENIQKNINEYKLIKKNELNEAVIRNNDLFKMSNSIHQLNNTKDEKNESSIFKDLNLANDKINNFNIINKNNKNENLILNKKNKNEICNFFLTKKSEKKLNKNFSFLNKKRLNTSDNTSKSEKENHITKNKNNKSIKVVNFNVNNVNKTINQNDVNTLSKEFLSS